MQDCKFRKLKKNETELIEKLSLIEKEIFGEAGFNRFTIPMFASWGRYYIYEGTEDILAGAQVIKTYDNPKTVYMAGFWVQKKYRDKGTGRSFLRRVIEQLKKEGINQIILTTDPANAKNVLFYKKAGFKIISNEKDYYGKGVDRYLMSRKNI